MKVTLVRKSLIAHYISIEPRFSITNRWLLHYRFGEGCHFHRALRGKHAESLPLENITARFQDTCTLRRSEG